MRSNGFNRVVARWLGKISIALRRWKSKTGPPGGDITEEKETLLAIICYFDAREIVLARALDHGERLRRLRRLCARQTRWSNSTSKLVLCLRNACSWLLTDLRPVQLDALNDLQVARR